MLLHRQDANFGCLYGLFNAKEIVVNWVKFAGRVDYCIISNYIRYPFGPKPSGEYFITQLIIDNQLQLQDVNVSFGISYLQCYMSVETILIVISAKQAKQDSDSSTISSQ